jgi:hypothetical protein
MQEKFKPDFWLWARESKGYYAWVERERWRLQRKLGRGKKHCMCHEHENSHHLVEAIFEVGLELHPVIDIAFEAFARAEARLSMRFVPQWSNEERLTGHLVSELESAVFIASEPFRQLCRAR